MSSNWCILVYLDLQSTQNNGLDPKTKGIWAVNSSTLEVQVGLAAHCCCKVCGGLPAEPVSQ